MLSTELPATVFISMDVLRCIKQRVNPNGNTERRTGVTAQARPTWATEQASSTP